MPTASTNTLRVLLKILSAPYQYNNGELVDRLALPDAKALRRYLGAIQDAGLPVDRNAHHKLAILSRPGFKELNYLSPLSPADKARITGLLNYLPEAEALQLRHKVDTLYDYQALGLESLRAPEVEKIAVVEEAIRSERRVVLRNYRSKSSNDERDRELEVFHHETEKRLVRAYDPGKQRVAHFLITRCERIELLDTPWRYGALHHNHAVDVFDIVDKRQVMVHLTLDVAAYNDLVERHPSTRQHLRRGSAPNSYDFQGRVNAKFIGLLPFIIANFRGVSEIRPEELRVRLREEVGAMRDQFG